MSRPNVLFILSDQHNAKVPRERFAADYPEGFGELYNLTEDCRPIIRELQADLADWSVTPTRPKAVLPKQPADPPDAVVRYGNAVCPDGKMPPDHPRSLRRRNYV